MFLLLLFLVPEVDLLAPVTLPFCLLANQHGHGAAKCERTVSRLHIFFSKTRRNSKTSSSVAVVRAVSIVWFQKISIPPPQRELEIPKGREVKDPGNSRGEGGWMIDLVSRGPLIQYGFQKSLLTY